MKLIDTIQDILREQTSNLTVPEQTLLGFLNRFLRGEVGEFEKTPDKDLEKVMLFNSKTIYPMAQRLLEKKNTGKKTYNDNEFIEPVRKLTIEKLKDTNPFLYEVYRKGKFGTRGGRILYGKKLLCRITAANQT